MNDAYTMQLEGDSGEYRQDELKQELIGVEGVLFCCGDSNEKAQLDSAAINKLGRRAREVFLHRAALPCYDYIPQQNQPQNADVRYMNNLRRQRDWSTGLY